VVFDMQPKPIF